MRVHLFPSRTQKLSSSVPTILAGRLAGKIGYANIISEAVISLPRFFATIPPGCAGGYGLFDKCFAWEIIDFVGVPLKELPIWFRGKCWVVS